MLQEAEMLQARGLVESAEMLEGLVLATLATTHAALLLEPPHASGSCWCADGETCRET